MTNKVLSALLGILIISSAGLVIMSSQYQQKAQQAESEFSLSGNFYPLQLPESIDSGSEYTKLMPVFI
ncbi:hypothetical protein [Lactobacillus sp. UCMA15818]|uniref:hypothetical protein n=1 Tax=Lactobacillus sp. UCMA15818 TaxID=2583394 RepID=UPI0025B04E36|nr:hypothetical protein [Lactobacillus sp. UCMA15818]MDN2453416.1 hypothetical protein [Lactobacillus sp. UCMA15818]